MPSAIYSYPWLYRWAMRLRFGAHYRPRLEAVAREIPYGASVVDLCCGDSAIYEKYLRKRRVDYAGIDINEKMISGLRKKGIDARVDDIRTFQPPEADVVICLGALLHFPENVDAVIERAKAAAKKVVILEPVRYAPFFFWPPIFNFAARACDFGEGPVRFRFTAHDLMERWRRHGVSRIETVGGEIMGVWE